MDDIREALMSRAYLYEDPDTFRAGVEAALNAVGMMMHPSFGIADTQAAAAMAAPSLELV